MTSETQNAKNHVSMAKQLAREHGVDVLGWNEKPGQEFISVNGGGDKLPALQKAMEKLGWYTWPVAEDQEGAFMDFAMRPPPAVTTATSRQATVAEDLAEATAVGKPTFYYAGPGTLFRTQWWLGILPALYVWRLKTPALPLRATIAIAAFLFVFVVLLTCDWIEISAADGKLALRKHFFGKIRTIDVADIKTAKIFKPTDRNGKPASEFIHVSVKSGKSFDLFLPAKRQTELTAWIRQRTATPASQKA